MPLALVRGQGHKYGRLIAYQAAMGWQCKSQKQPSNRALVTKLGGRESLRLPVICFSRLMSRCCRSSWRRW